MEGASELGRDFRLPSILVDSTRRKPLIRWQKRAAAWEHAFLKHLAPGSLRTQHPRPFRIERE